MELQLRRCPEQPRPAWIAVNEQRIDRRIGSDYAQSFAAPDGRAMNVRDPLHQLVYRFYISHWGKREPDYIGLTTCLGITLLISYLVWIGLEVPCRRAVKRRLQRTVFQPALG